jgi:heat shock protein HslJ
VALCTASCSNETLTSPTSAEQLNGTWRLFQMTQGGAVHNETPTAGRFNATFVTGRIDLKADCNTCSGPATLSGSTLTVGALACTTAACASAPIDTRFTSVLSGAVTVRINDRLLQLNSAQGELRFER